MSEILLKKGKIVGLASGEFGVVSDVDLQNGRILVDFGDREDWVSISCIDRKFSALLRADAALRELSEVLFKMFGQEEREGPEEKVILPTTPTTPFIEKLPPAPPGFPEELKEFKPVVDVAKLEKVSKRTAEILRKISEIAKEHAKLQQEIKTIESQVKPLRQAAKERMYELHKLAEEVIKTVEQDFKGTEELKHVIALWQDRVVYILRWLTTIKDEPSDAEKLEMLWKILEKEIPAKKVEEIKTKLSRAVAKATEVSTELDTYLAILPFTAFKIGAKKIEVEGQVIRSIVELGRRLWDVLKRAVRSLLGIRSEIESATVDIESIVAALEKVKV